MNYYPFHIGDFRSGTNNMSRQARWIYRDMLDIYYDTEKPLTLDLDVLCNEIGAEDDAERKIVERHLRFKFTKTDEGYQHDICDKVIAEYRAKAETAKANGRLGGRPAKEAQENKPSGFQSGSEQDAISNQEQSGLKANQEPRTKNQEIKSKTKTPATPSASPDLFDGINPQVVADFKVMRTKQRAAITKTAIDGIQREADKAGIDLQAALTMCCERGWRGFKAEWISQQAQARASPSQPQSRHSGFDKIDYSEGITDGRIT